MNFGSHASWADLRSVSFSDVSPTSEITGALMVAPRKTVSGSSFFNAVLGAGAGGNETIGMKQRSFGVAWGLKF